MLSLNSSLTDSLKFANTSAFWVLKLYYNDDSTSTNFIGLKFKKMNSIESGINFVGQVREFLSIDNYLFVLNNDEKIQTYQLKNQ